MKMMWSLILLLKICFFISCSDGQPSSEINQNANVLSADDAYEGETGSNNKVLRVQKKLPKSLKEISGIVADGEFVWAVTDERVPFIYKLDQQGNLVQTVEIENVKMKDVEAVNADADFIYVGDIGDNDGDREKRTIYKIAKASIGSGSTAKVKAEAIHFSFKDFEESKKKKKNEYDAEGMLNRGDALYIFTKRRNDDKTELVSVPKTPGTYVAKSIALFNSKGLITGAGINSSGTEVALIGYDNGHHHSFIWILSDFNSENVFSGKQERFELTNEKIDWQTEGITFSGNDVIYFSSEKTDDVPATLYAVDRKKLSEVQHQKIK